MYISAGFLKRRKLRTVKGDSVRPTAQKIRASLFNILQHSIEGARFLDICAGNGAVGIEAISQGAQSSVFIEKHKAPLEALLDNITTLSIKEQCSVLFKDARQGLQRAQGPFDIIFFDPPYNDHALYKDVIVFLDNNHSILASEGILIVESVKGFDFSFIELKKLQEVKARTYGNSTLTFFELPHDRS